MQSVLFIDAALPPVHVPQSFVVPLEYVPSLHFWQNEFSSYPVPALQTSAQAPLAITLLVGHFTQDSGPVEPSSDHVSVGHLMQPDNLVESA